MTNVGGGGGGGASAAGGGGGAPQGLVEENDEELIIPPMPELEDVRLAEGPNYPHNPFRRDKIDGVSATYIALGRLLRKYQLPLAAAAEGRAIKEIQITRDLSAAIYRLYDAYLAPEDVAMIRLLPPEDAAQWRYRAIIRAFDADMKFLLTHRVVHDLPGPGGHGVHRAALPGAVAARIIRNYRPIVPEVVRRAMGLRPPLPAAVRRAVQHVNRHFLLHELAPDVIPHPLERPRSSRRQRKSRKTRKSRKNQRV